MACTIHLGLVKSSAVDNWCCPSLQPPRGELCNSNINVMHDQGTPFVAFPVSQAGEKNTQVVHDVGAAFVALLRVCTKNKDLCSGTRMHDDIVKRGMLEMCSDALVTMYAKCGALAKAKTLLDMHKSRDVITWTALIAGYAREGQGRDALNCYECMQREGICPDAVTYACILKACGMIGATNKGKQIHEEITRQGLLQDNIVLGNALVDMYAKCDDLAKAQCVLEELPSRNVVSWNALIARYAQQGRGEQALNCLEHMQRDGICPNAVTYTCLLKACGTLGVAEKGKQIHDEIARRELLRDNIVLGTALVDMYSKCGALANAEVVLQELSSRDVVAWNALIAGYIQHGPSEQALICFERMQRECICPNVVTYVCILKACGMIGAGDKGKQIHDKIVRQGLLQDNLMLGTALVDMYAKCGALAKAERVLEELPSRDVVSWNALIAGYAQHGQGEQALTCFKCMVGDYIRPDVISYACILKACGTIGAADKGKQVHDEIARQGLLRDNVVLGTALVDMYAKCGALAKAESVFEELSRRDVVSWNALIAGYAQHGPVEQALSCFECMHNEGICPDTVTYAIILKACGTVGAVDKGKQIHDEIARRGLLQVNVVLGTALVEMYAKCSALEKAEHVLDGLHSQDVVSWNALVAGYAEQGQGEQALNCFERMQREGICPDAVTYACILKACGTVGAVNKGKRIHESIVIQGLLQDNIVLGTALVDMYAKCGDLAKAERLLEELPSRDVVSWNALISGYAQQGQGKQALDCFERMQCEDICPNVMTYACILKACGTIGTIDKGIQIHDEIARQGLLQTNIVLGNALVDMYAKCHALARAERVLVELPSRDVVSWNALIAGYAQQGQGEQALNSFECMQSEVILPDAVTYACILKACASIGATDKGKQIHDEITRLGLLQNNIVLGNALVDMYVKCGALTKAEHVLEELLSRDVVSWNALITGYAQQGQSEQVLNCFECMQLEGIPPDAATFSCLLNVCSHLGLVEEGQTLFVVMSTKYDIRLDVEAYTCIIDLIGRAGQLEKAVRLIQKMPSSDYPAIWHALLGACKKWGDTNVGRWAFDQAVLVDKRDKASYALMANIYAASGMQENAQNPGE